jgi:radical SAM superfamily enzyme YgiQ (UPF0313 family)
MQARGWEELDILLLSGDAYIDHPSFGSALIGRLLLSLGLRVGLIAQPRFRVPEDALADIQVMGRPRLFAGVSAGALDSMLAHYTAFRKKRRDDAYTPGGRAGARPDRACIVYTGLLRRAFPGLPVILGGIEASMRRAAHYDFWTDTLRRPLLLDAKADITVYGMGERSIKAIAHLAQSLEKAVHDKSLSERPDPAQPATETFQPLSRTALVKACRHLPGISLTASIAEAQDWFMENKITAHELPAFTNLSANPSLLLRATLDLEKISHQGKTYAIQRCGDRMLIIAPPAAPLSTEELDAVHALPFTRLPHPACQEAIPAWESVRASIQSHRGCAGGCAFCSLAQHQGRRISSRSRKSILAEASAIAGGCITQTMDTAPPHPDQTASSPQKRKKIPAWAGSISDVSGPSANMWQARCLLSADKSCPRPSCLHPRPCPLFQVDQGLGIALLREISSLPGVRHVRVAGGIRIDLALQDQSALAAYAAEFTGGQLKTAPEHISPDVLLLMRKPAPELFEKFLHGFNAACRAAGKEQYVIPYLMSAHPGCSEADMRSLSAWLKARNWKPRQVQCFIPTPGTVSTAMFYSGLGPDFSPIPVARTDAERLRQHRLLAPNPRLGDGRNVKPMKTRS